MSDKPIPSITLLGTATREVANDVLAITYRTTQQGVNADKVQDQVRADVTAALEVIRDSLKPGEVDVETNSFQISPRHNAKGKIDGYVGAASITVKGTDTATISELASQIKTMTVYGTANALSRKLRQSIEAELAAAAIEDFRQKATAAGQGFGWKDWELGDVNIRTDGGNQRSGKMFTLSASASGGGLETAPRMEVEGGKSEITTTVSGSITKKK